MTQDYKMKTNDHRNFGGSFVGLCGTQIFFKCLSADFSSIGAHYDYAPDAEGNRIFQETGIGTTNYLHDNANRMTSANGVSCT
jgi:hypothetical protein